MFRRSKHKFNAKPMRYDGQHFDSTLEFDYFKYLQLLIKAGEVLYFHRQVPVSLPGGTKYQVDYQVFYSDGTVHYVDVKGMETDTFKIKKREVEAIYPFDIEIVKKGDF